MAPSYSRFENFRTTKEFGSFDILLVLVSQTEAVSEYVRAYPTSAESAERETGAVTHRYTLRPR